MLIPFKAVIFDFDDTIVATYQARCASITTAAKDFGHELSEQVVREHWGQPFRKWITAVLPGVDLDEFESHHYEVMLKYPAKAVSGARELLERLSAQGILMGIVSSNANGMIQQDLEQLDLTRYFMFIHGANDIEFHKPDPRALHLALETLNELGIAKEEIVVVGDRVTDYWAASGNSLRFIGVTSGLQDEDAFLEAGLSGQYIVSSLLVLADDEV